MCLNNGLYGMTGGQVAPTTLTGQKTTTTPYGNTEESFDLCRLAETAGATYVARWTTAHPHQALKALRKGIRKKGTAFIEILSQCPVHNKRSPVEMLRDFKKNTHSLRKAPSAGEGGTAVGEFCDRSRAEWTASYQKIIDQFSAPASPP